MRTIERAFFWSFLSTFVICFCAFAALFVVVDLFDNADEFFRVAQQQSWQVALIELLTYYGRRLLFVFDAAVMPLLAATAMIFLLIVHKRNELKPMLSAGVPTWRVLSPPLLLATAVIVGLMIFNREFLIGGNAHQLHASRGNDIQQFDVQPSYDRESRILLDGESLDPNRQVIFKPAFVIPKPEIAHDMQLLRAETAIYATNEKGQNGWYLVNCPTKREELELTKLGETLIHTTKHKGDLFFVSDVGPDALYKTRQAVRYLTTTDLLQRLQSKAFDSQTLLRISSECHRRLMEPLCALCFTLLLMPVMIRKESRGIILNAMIACGVTIGWLVILEATKVIATSALLSPALAAFLPIILALSLLTWFWPQLES